MTLSTQSILQGITAQPQNQVFYRQLSEEEARRITGELLSCLKVFDELCRQNGLVYLIVAGGLIGLVREGGLLPWDDDIDIVMPREDYRRFKEVLQNSKYRDEYSYIFPEDNHVITMGAHFYNKNHSLTKLVSDEIGNSNIYESYSYLDISPLDYCMDNPVADKIRGTLVNAIQMGYISRRCFKKNDPYLAYLSGQSRSLRLNLLIRKLFALPFTVVPKKLLFRQLDRLLDRRGKSGRMTITYGAWRYFGEQLPTEVFLPTKDMPLDDMMAMTPGDSKRYLEHRYGNYMAVPTEQERNSRMVRLREDWFKYIPEEAKK